MLCGMTQCDSRAGGRAWVCSWHTEPVRCGDCYLAQHAFPSEDMAHLASKHPWQLSQIIYSHFTPKHYHGGNAFCICKAYSKWLLIVLGCVYDNDSEQRLVQPNGDLPVTFHVGPSGGCVLTHTKTGSNVLSPLRGTRRSKVL